MYDKKISVIMGVYNQFDEEQLHSAVNSILEQSEDDLEFIIYNDGSTPEATESINRLKSIDERIIILDAKENNGLAFSLNMCIERARGKYIARMDADDISFKNRLKVQVRFLENHPEYHWCGTNAVLFDENGEWGDRIMPETPEKGDFLKYSPYIHPSVMYRAQLFEEVGKYSVNKETLRCEDYEIFMRFHNQGYRGYNIQEKLFAYREGRVSYNKRKIKHRINEAKIRHRNFKEMGMLTPKGWLYVVRPLVGIVIPNKLLYKIKRSKDEKKQYIKEANLHKNIGEGTNILTSSQRV